MAEWLIERGIGETRAALVEQDRILEARIVPDCGLAAGAVVRGRLSHVGPGGRNAVATLSDGTELLLPQRPAGISEGTALNLEILRESIPGGEPWKRPLARATGRDPAPAPPLAEQLGGGGVTVRELPCPDPRQDRLEEAGWSDLLAEAASGLVEFPGGRLRLSPTPAMTLIDVDGALPPSELAITGAAAAAQAIRRLDIGGSIGIDLPTAGGKAARHAAGEALDRAMAGTAFERTAVNGFGFLQLVRPRRRASLLELYAGDRTGAEARALLRRASRHCGTVRLAAHPSVIALIAGQQDWLHSLNRQIGGTIALQADPSLAISAGHAQAFA